MNFEKPDFAAPEGSQASPKRVEAGEPRSDESEREGKYNIIGKDITPELKAEASSLLDRKRDEAMEPIEGEYKKTPEELTFIKLIDQYLNEELKELGIERTIETPPSQIHLLPASIYNETYGGFSKAKESRAFFSPAYQSICVNRDKSKNRTALYRSIIHESIHKASFPKFIHKKEKIKLLPTELVTLF